MKPLVPAEVDLRGLPFMPLDVNRLRDSQLAISASGDEFRAAVLLWCASWNQIPAASLPADDQTLASYSGFGRDLKGWRKVKSGAMRGFVQCDDGRFYHPVVAEKALEAWQERVEFRERQDNDQERVKNYRVEHKALRDALRELGITMPFDAKISDLRAKLEEIQNHETVTETVTPETLQVTQPVTETVTPVTGTCNALAMAKTGTGTGTGTGTDKDQKQKQKKPPSASADALPGKTSKTKRAEVTFAQWMATIPPDQDAIPQDHHVFRYADDVGLPRDFLEMAWRWFEKKYADSKKRYADWSKVFRLAVENNWAHLWWITPEGAYQLTTVGQQFARSLDKAA